MAFKEIVRETFNNHVVRSRIEKVADLKQARAEFSQTGECHHQFVEDEPGWLYDVRSCAICGQGLGVV